MVSAALWFSCHNKRKHTANHITNITLLYRAQYKLYWIIMWTKVSAFLFIHSFTLSYVNFSFHSSSNFMIYTLAQCCCVSRFTWLLLWQFTHMREIDVVVHKQKLCTDEEEEENLMSKNSKNKSFGCERVNWVEIQMCGKHRVLTHTLWILTEIWFLRRNGSNFQLWFKRPKLLCCRKRNIIQIN